MLSDLSESQLQPNVEEVERLPISRTFLRPPNPDGLLSTAELIRKYGYPVEMHKIITKDGYILTTFRIPHGKNSATKTPNTKGAVYIHHGFLCSSAVWVVNTPSKVLPYLLADDGFDVWLGNARGNNYSLEHLNMTYYNPNQSNSSFWKFSYHEMGVYDIPAAFDYILEKSGQEQIFHIGHSMGTTVVLVALSEFPEYNSKIKAMFGLAPVAYLTYVSSPIRLLAPLVQVETDALDTLGEGQLIQTAILKKIYSLSPKLCALTVLADFSLCDHLIFVLNGYDPSQSNSTVTSAVLGHLPSSTSTRTAVHLTQQINSGVFRQYDYGKAKNLKKYGSINPPKYDLSKVTTDAHLYYGEADTLAHPKDVIKLHNSLTNSKHTIKRVDWDSWNHLDFTYGNDAPLYVYNDIIQKMNSYVQ